MFENKTVLVTGAAGSIGSAIVRHLIKNNARKIIALDINEIDLFMLKKSVDDNRLEIIGTDIKNRNSLEEIFLSNKIDVIYHAAAMKHVVTCEQMPYEAVLTNIAGTQNIVDMSVKYGTEKFILISTDKAAYPMNVMGATKFIAERIVLNANKTAKGDRVFSCVRFGNVANTRGSVIPIFVQNLIDNKPITVTNLSVTRFIMRMKDTIDLIFRATKYATGGEVFILKMNSFRLDDLVDVMKTRIAPIMKIKPENVEVLEIGLVPGEKIHEDLVNDLEFENIYEMDGMYVVSPKHLDGKEKTTLIRYSSKDAPMIQKEEIEKIVFEYLEESFHISRFK